MVDISAVDEHVTDLRVNSGVHCFFCSVIAPFIQYCSVFSSWDEDIKIRRWECSSLFPSSLQ